MVEPQEHDRQIPENAVTPQFGRAAASPPYDVGRRPHRRARIDHVACETLEEAGLRGVDAEVTKLYLRLRPGQCGRAHEGVRLAELVDEIQNAFSRSGSAGPERNAHRAARRYAHPIPEREHRVK